MTASTLNFHMLGYGCLHLFKLAWGDCLFGHVLWKKGNISFYDIDLCKTHTYIHISIYIESTSNPKVTISQAIGLRSKFD